MGQPLVCIGGSSCTCVIDDEVAVYKQERTIVAVHRKVEITRYTGTLCIDHPCHSQHLERQELVESDLGGTVNSSCLISEPPWQLAGERKNIWQTLVLCRAEAICYLPPYIYLFMKLPCSYACTG